MSVGPSVGPSVRNAFVKIAKNGVMQDEDVSYVVYTALFSTSFADFRRFYESVTDRRTDGHNLLKRCEDASKKIPRYSFVNVW